MSFPDEYTLNGPDAFLSSLDRLMLKNCRRGNICHFEIKLAAPLSSVVIEKALEIREAYQWAIRLRLHMGFWGQLPKWKRSNGKASAFSLREGSVDVNQLRPSLNPKSESPFQITGYGTAEEVHSLLFTWHHALMDAHGAELFIRDLGGALGGDPIYLDPKSPVSDHSQWKNALEIKEKLYEINSFPFLSTYRGKLVKPSVNENRVLRFTEEETRQIEANMQSSGAGLNKSNFYLAACATSVTQIVKERGEALDDIVVTLPQDRRRRGAIGPLFRNQVTFLFYRIPSDVLGSMKGIIATLGQQMMDLMRQQFPQRFLQMMNLFRHLPPPFHAFMLQQPTKKRMASFFFSDTGNSLDDFATFLGADISSAIHYPPNMLPPGLTFIFSRHLGCLQITLGEVRNESTSEASDRWERLLKESLLTVEQT